MTELDLEVGVNSPSTRTTTTSTREPATRGEDPNLSTPAGSPDFTMTRFHGLVAERDALAGEVRQLRANLDDLREIAKSIIVARNACWDGGIDGYAVDLLNLLADTIEPLLAAPAADGVES